MSNDDRDYNQYQDHLPPVRRLYFMDMAMGMFMFSSAQVLFGMTLASAMFMAFVNIAYFLPVFFFLLFVAKFGTRWVFWAIYKFIPATKENRWTLNSFAMAFWTLPLAVTLPAAVVWFLSMFFAIPYGIIAVTFFDMSATEANLIGVLMTSIFESATFSDALIKVFWYDAQFQVISIIKILGCFIAPSFFFYAHKDVTKQEFVTSDADCRLIFE